MSKPRFKGDCKIRMGYRVIGPNTANGDINTWWQPTLKEAMQMAKRLALATGEEVEVCKYLGGYRPKKMPVEFLQADDAVVAMKDRA